MKTVFENGIFRFEGVDKAIGESMTSRGIAKIPYEDDYATPWAGHARMFCPVSDPAPIAQRETFEKISLQLSVSKELLRPEIDSKYHWLFDRGLFPYQIPGVWYCIQRNETLLADEPGLGKTAQAILAAEAKGCRSILVICPAMLTINWKKEFGMWHSDPGSLDLVVVSYNKVCDEHDILSARVWDLVILDECHYIKEPSALRTMHVVGRKNEKIAPIAGTNKIAISGTPMMNRPMELYTQMRWLNRYAFPNQHKFGQLFCDAKRGPRGWDYKGASNLDLLQKMLRSRFMIRRLKKNVLDQLPDKIRKIVEISADTRVAKVLRDEWSFFGVQDPTKLTEDQFLEVVAHMDANMGKLKADEHLATMRMQAAMYKAPKVIEHINELIESPREKVVVFAWHRSVIELFERAFAGICVSVYGGVSDEKKQKAVDRFQNDEKIKVFIGNLQSAGVGITLTEGSRVVMAESAWTPFENEQCEDRCHRIGQKDTVYAEYFVLEGSVEARVLRMSASKKKTLLRATNVSAEDEALARKMETMLQ